MYLEHKNNAGIDIDVRNDDIDAFVYIKILTLLYADDTVLIAQDPASLQKCLNDFYDYCLKWKLKINHDKSKIIVFGSSKHIDTGFISTWEWEYISRKVEVSYTLENI